MKKFIVVVVFTLVSTSSFAMKCNSASCENAKAVVLALESDKTPVRIKNLLIAVLNGPTEGIKTAILSNKVVDAAAGTIYRTIEVGVDNVNDDDDSWDSSSVYEISIKTVDGKVTEVKILSLAG